MPNIIIKNEFGEDEIYNGINTVRFLTDTGETVSFNHGGAKPNIAWGDTAPQKTDKLWVKYPEPESYLATVAPIVGSIGAADLSDVAWISYYAKKAVCASVGNYAYMFGGANQSNVTYKTIIKLDTTTNTRTVLTATLPDKYVAGGCAAVGTDIYLFGGSNTPKAIYKFDTLTEQVTTLSTALPAEYSSVAPCAAVGSSIYVLGGSTGVGNAAGILKFDTETESITELSATLPARLGGHCAAAFHDYIYVVGGWDNGKGAVTDAIIRFDTKTESAETLTAKLPTAVSDISCAVFGSNIYLFGGNPRNAVYLSSILKFNVLSETISVEETSFPSSLCESCCTAIADGVYVFGGNTGTSTLDRVYKYQPAAELPAGTAYIHIGNENLFDFIPGVAVVGVTAAYVGNSSGLAEVAEAYLFNEDAGEWTAI